MRYGLLALDIDGTLLDSHHALQPRVAGAVRAARTAGVRVALATGKLLPSIAPLLDALALDGPQITLNGAAIQQAETGATLRFMPLGERDRRLVIEAVRDADPAVLIAHFALDAIYMDRAHPDAAILAAYGEGPPVLVPDLLAAGLPAAAKILLAGEPARLAALRAALAPALGRRVTLTTTADDFLEFFAHEAGKGPALVALRTLLGLARAQVVAIGDGENDVPLLREAGLAIAMANGAALTRAQAHRIVPSNDEDGVAVAIERLLREQG